MIKNYFKDWNKLEIVLLVLSVILILGVGFLLKCDFLTTVVAFIGFFSALNQAKGKVLGQVVGVFVSIFYSILSYRNKYYGEVIIYLFMILPLYIAGIYTWLKNSDKNTNTVKKSELTKNEWGVLLVIGVVLFVVLYFILKAFDTNQLLVSAISMIVNLMATYLLVRRSKYSFLFYTINAFILLLLWGIPVLNGDYLLIPMVFDALLLLVNDIYGLIKWNK